MERIILVTGHPGIGKTTFVKKVVAKCGALALTGFYTEEVREQGVRVGFRAVTLSGSSAVFAHQDFHTLPQHKVGKYGVRPEVLEGLVLAHIDAERKQADLVVIDEIAKMELISKIFRQKLLDILDAGPPILATVALMGTGLIKSVKRRPDALLFTLQRDNRDRLVGPVADAVSRAVRATSSRPIGRHSGDQL